MESAGRFKCPIKIRTEGILKRFAANAEGMKDKFTKEMKIVSEDLMSGQAKVETAQGMIKEKLLTMGNIIDRIGNKEGKIYIKS